MDVQSHILCVWGMHTNCSGLVLHCRLNWYVKLCTCAVGAVLVIQGSIDHQQKRQELCLTMSIDARGRLMNVSWQRVQSWLSANACYERSPPLWERKGEWSTCAHACNHMRNTHTHAPGNTLNRCERRPQAHNGLNTVGVRLGVGPGLWHGKR